MTRSRIAVVDDSEEIRELLVDLLSADGYDVLALRGDEPALVEELVAGSPDLLILDLLLEGPTGPRSGWDILRAIRGDARLDGLPVLVCSADTMALRAQASTFRRDSTIAALEKPFTIEDLEASVAELVAGESVPAWDDEHDLVLVADRDATLVHASTAALGELSLSRVDLGVLRVADIVADGRAWTEREWKRFLESRRWEGAVTLLTRDGRRLPAWSHAEIVTSGPAVWYVSRLTLRDEPQSVAG